MHDVGRSAAFYRRVLGCEEHATAAGVRLSLADAYDGLTDTIEILAGRPIAGMPVLDSFTIEAPSPEAVDQIYASARREDVRVLPVREAAGTRQCVIFDPDGYKVEVFARIVPL